MTVQRFTAAVVSREAVPWGTAPVYQSIDLTQSPDVLLKQSMLSRQSSPLPKRLFPPQMTHISFLSEVWAVVAKQPNYKILSTHCQKYTISGDHHSGGICQATPTTPGRHGFWLIDWIDWLIDWLIDWSIDWRDNSPKKWMGHSFSSLLCILEDNIRRSGTAMTMEPSDREH